MKGKVIDHVDYASNSNNAKKQTERFLRHGLIYWETTSFLNNYYIVVEPSLLVQPVPPELVFNPLNSVA